MIYKVIKVLTLVGMLIPLLAGCGRDLQIKPEVKLGCGLGPQIRPAATSGECFKAN